MLSREPHYSSTCEAGGGKIVVAPDVPDVATDPAPDVSDETNEPAWEADGPAEMTEPT